MYKFSRNFNVYCLYTKHMCVVHENKKSSSRIMWRFIDNRTLSSINRCWKSIKFYLLLQFKFGSNDFEIIQSAYVQHINPVTIFIKIKIISKRLAIKKKYKAILCKDVLRIYTKTNQWKRIYWNVVLFMLNSVSNCLIN